MKILVAGPYRDGTGYSHAAIEYIMSLLETDADIVCRHVEMTQTSGDCPDIINDLERKNVEGVDKILQYNLPLTYVKNGRAENVGGFAYETLGMPSNEWLSGINKMDKIIVPCEFQRDNVLRFSSSKPTYVVPHSVDTSEEYRNEDLEDIKLPIDKNTLVFYTISENTPRKNLQSLILSYFMAFSASDNVALVIKTHTPGIKGSAAKNQIQQLIEAIKSQSKRFGNDSVFPRVIVTTDYVSDKKIRAIHRLGHVFVSASHGEGWCLPFIDAINNGNAAIIPEFGAFLDHKSYLEKIGVDYVSGLISPCFGASNSLGVYTSNESWFTISIGDMASKMHKLYLYNRDYYLDSSTKQLRQEYISNNFNRKTIGQKLVQALGE